ncbi:hypothetical protein CANCADRAFT_4186 [Tortispora caseinolytica NRRL Y-17796]|uniref:Sfi1 spindle body domain-containing protein n=1 Tax=Tortispora caseinolytica NRRL Y-17796 TaxID=767744 RepID=A0A1E4TCV1_9ASCO|nr:hypothetical protein CANCADRAFT_4186 [Tortispora caseinolytica NRRL Y-17796]
MSDYNSFDASNPLKYSSQNNDIADNRDILSHNYHNDQNNAKKIDDSYIYSEEQLLVLQSIAKAAHLFDPNGDSFLTLYRIYQQALNNDLISDHNASFSFIAKLASVNLPTWKERFEYLVELTPHYGIFTKNEYISFHKHALDIAYQSFQLQKLNAYFNKWCRHTTRRLRNRYIALDHAVPIIDAWNFKHVLNKWRSHLTSNNQQRSRAIDFNNRILSKTAFHAWKNQLSASQLPLHAADLLHAKKYLLNWRASRAYYTFLATSSKSTYNKKTLTRSFHIWTKMLHLNQAQLNFSTSVKSKVLAKWRIRNLNNAELMNDAIFAHDCITTSKYLHTMSIKLHDLKQKQSLADIYNHRRLLRITFSHWAAAVPRSERLKHFIAKRNELITKKALRRWIHSYANYSIAYEFLSQSLSSKALQTWRLNTRLNLHILKSEVDLLSLYMKSWKLNTRLSLYTSELNYRSALTTIACWNQQYQKVKKLEHSAQLMRENGLERRQKLSVLSAWSLKTYYYENSALRAEALYYATKAHGALKSWQKQMKLHLGDKDKATYICSTRIAKRSLCTWKSALEAKQTAHRETLLSSFLQAQNSKKKKAILHKWRYLFKQVTSDLKGKADEFYRDYSKLLAKKAMRNWYSYYVAILANIIKAGQFYDQLCLNMFYLWHNYFEEILLMLEDADGQLYAYSSRKTISLFRSWNLRLFRVKSMNEEASRLKTRSERSLMRKLFNKWAESTSKSNNQNKVNIASTAKSPLSLAGLSLDKKSAKSAQSAQFATRDMASTPRSIYETPIRRQVRRKALLTPLNLKNAE